MSLDNKQTTVGHNMEEIIIMCEKQSYITDVLLILYTVFVQDDVLLGHQPEQHD